MKVGVFMKKTLLYSYIMELIKKIDTLKEEEDSCNEGCLTDDEYNSIMFTINKILKFLDFIF